MKLPSIRMPALSVPEKNRAAWNITIALGFIGLAVPYLIWDSEKTPSLGDWGDYVGGLGGTIALIRLIVGHYQNQEKVRSTNEEFAHQIELTHELLGAMTRLASATQTHASATTTLLTGPTSIRSSGPDS